MSTLNVIRPGLGNTNSYLTSGIPFVTASVALPGLTTNDPVAISFPQVTKFITIKNTTPDAHSIRIGFSENGVLGTNYFLLEKDESFSAELRVTDIYCISNSNGGNGNEEVTVIAGLTTIDRNELKTNWSGSAGVG